MGASSTKYSNNANKANSPMVPSCPWKNQVVPTRRQFAADDSVSLVTINVEDDEEFTFEEIAILRKTFEVIKERHELLAPKLLESVMVKVEGAEKLYESGEHEAGNNWSDVTLGMILLSGIERFLLRLQNPDALKAFVSRLVNKHIAFYQVSPQMLMLALQASQAPFMTELRRQHNEWRCGNNNNNDENVDSMTNKMRHNNNMFYSNNINNNCNKGCDICQAWNKFFRVVCGYFARVNQFGNEN